ncbi:MAG: toll/interleukin-1 receptor domain-containing protein [Saprospiraceae bacterium]
MKYGIPINTKTREINWNGVRAFNDDHWAGIAMKIANGEKCGWIPFPKLKVFISFSSHDKELMECLFKEILLSELVEPYKVESDDHSDEDLGPIVAKGIRGCHFFVLLVSKKSVSTQWINQELGFAYGVRKLKGKRITIIEEPAINMLKGFIHENKQFPYKFNLDGEPSFSNTCLKLREGLEKRVIKEFKINVTHY